MRIFIGFEFKNKIVMFFLFLELQKKGGLCKKGDLCKKLLGKLWELSVAHCLAVEHLDLRANVLVPVDNFQVACVLASENLINLGSCPLNVRDHSI